MVPSRNVSQYVMEKSAIERVSLRGWDRASRGGSAVRAFCHGFPRQASTVENFMSRIQTALAAAASIAVLSFAGTAQAAPHGVKVGLLTCHVESGWGYVLGSSKNMHCSYQPNHGDVDRYDGSISKFGVDIGYTRSAVIEWDVVAPSSDVRRGALQGDYAGATASATVGGGVGAHVLLGGFDKSIALQPLSVEGSTGFDIAAGVGEMSLEKVAQPMPAAERFEEHAELTPAVTPAPEPPPPVVRKHRMHHHREYCPKPQ
jgi:hypothetical protein